MKWNILIIPLVVFMIEGLLMIEDGFGENSIICRNPFCQKTSSTICGGTRIAIITWPQNGSNFYWSAPSVNEDFNFTLSGFLSPSCSYKIDDGLWNNIMCANGDNSVYAITLPEGYPVTEYLKVSDMCGEVINQTQFSVYYKAGGVNQSTDILWFFLGILLLFMTMYLGVRLYYEMYIQKL